jgi:hypothetical protein
MFSIWKYELEGPGKETELEMPSGARIVHFAQQGGVYCLWAIVAPNAECEKSKFRIIGTGWDIQDHNFNYIGTLQDGPFVWHLLEL